MWDVSRAIPNGVLLAGAATQPYRLAFRIDVNGLDRKPKVELVSMKLEVLAP
jgi:hypothetical protein